MTLDKADISYRDNRRGRLGGRALIATVAGTLLDWKWLLIAIAIYSLEEAFSMYKILSHSQLTNKELKLSSYESGELSGKVTVYAFIAMLGTLWTATIIKIIKDLIVTYLF